MQENREKIVSEAQKLYDRADLYVYGSDGTCLTPYWDTHDWIIDERYRKLMLEDQKAKTK